jgi:hypothetical protein
MAWSSGTSTSSPLRGKVLVVEDIALTTVDMQQLRRALES